MNAPAKIEKIDKSGVYDLSDRVYHSDCCAGPSISATGLKTLLTESPAKYWRTSYLNPDRQPEPDRPHFRIGKAAHMMLLEPERVMQWIVKIPQDVLASNGAASTKEAKAIIAAAEAEGKIALKPDEWTEIIEMRNALAAHPHAKRALLKGRAEVSLIMHHEPTGVFIKSRPDFLPEKSGQYIVDYKTCADLVRWERTAALDMRYDIQAALMLWAAQEVQGIEAKGVLYLVQEKTPPYTVGMLAFSLEDVSSRAILNLARLDVRKALETFATCLDTNTWPTGYEMPREIVPPGWHMKDVEYRVTEADLDFPNAYAI